MENNNEYKASFYNIVVDENDNNKYIWNSKRGSIVELENELFDLLMKGDFDNDKMAPLMDDLCAEGFVVPKGNNEYEEILFHSRMRQFSLVQDSCGLVITPTMNCNYRCPYCFESTATSKREVMSPEVIDDVVKAVGKYFDEFDKCKQCRITWFGGEPLLGYDKVIVPLQSKLVALASKRGFDIRFNIITNGFFLTEDKFEFMFKKNFTKYVQVTFDGTAEEYAKRKGVTTDAYYRVFDNIMNLSKYIKDNDLDARVNIRLNVDNDNYPSLLEFVDNVRNDTRYSDCFTFALERLRAYDSCKTLNNYCSTEEFEMLEREFNAYVGKAPKVPEPKLTFCGQNCMNVFCVGVKGELYKCEHDFGIREHSVGNIRTGLNYSQYMNDFLNQPMPEKCKECKLVPICLGGCPHRRLANKQKVECDFTIENVKKSIRNYIKSGR